MLNGKTIWITRPTGQAATLITVLESLGARVVQLPMLAIEPLPIDAGIKKTVLDLDNYNLLFFISSNAAALGMALIHDYWPQFPEGVEIFAIGPTTAEMIGSYDRRVHFPESRMSSEALLGMDALADVAGKKALIVRGVGGRELLADALRARGASVDYLELYRRTRPHYRAGELAARLATRPPDAVVVTSAEALANLADLLPAAALATGKVPLFVSSDRIAAAAARSGFTRTVVMPGADDKAIITSLESTLT